MSSLNPAQASPRRSRIERIRTRIAHWTFLLQRPMTLGVRGIVFDAEGRVLLVRHGYVSGWYFPGGGVETNETCETSLARELEEEACIAIEGPTRLHGIFFNGRISPRDHVAVYLIDKFRVTAEFKPSYEIQEVRFFPLDALPDGVTPGTLRRLEEIRGSRPIESWW